MKIINTSSINCMCRYSMRCASIKPKYYKILLFLCIYPSEKIVHFFKNLFKKYKFSIKNEFMVSKSNIKTINRETYREISSGSGTPIFQRC